MENAIAKGNDMPQVLRVLCVHGVGRHPVGGDWEAEWAVAIRQACAQVDQSRAVEVLYCHYDDIFEQHRISIGDMLEAVARLVVNGITAPFRTARGADSSLRYTAGMVVKWVESEAFRRQTRERLKARIEATNPDVVLGHSLGSLVAYDTFTHPDTKALSERRCFVSLGSQIGNPFVRGEFRAGRLEGLPAARFWYHLYNNHDQVFTARISMAEDNFRQVDTSFDIPGIADHAAQEYLAHPQTVNTVWFDLVRNASTIITRSIRSKLQVAKRVTTPTQRALLIGINEYPDPEMRLAGCHNDVYLMSAMLQERGMNAENIRIVLDDRATASGIRERINWLLENCREDDERLFYYSGHGAQLPRYGLGDRVDRYDETLVPYDFDWSEERSLTDDWLLDRYAQLPYNTRFTMVLDCCNSGGLTRGSAHRIRGLDPPDDIRHRRLYWDVKHQMWRTRPLDLIGTRAKTVDQSTMHLTGMTGRLGFAMPLRTRSLQEMRVRRKQLDHYGPYMPLMLYACQADESAYEYEHGSSSYGAFTYALVKNWRKTRKGKPSVKQLVSGTSAELLELGYGQQAAVSGPDIRLQQSFDGPMRKKRR